MGFRKINFRRSSGPKKTEMAKTIKKKKVELKLRSGVAVKRVK